MREHSKAAPLDVLYDSKSSNVFKWMEWVIMDEHPFAFMESELTRKNSTLRPICVKTFKRYCFKLVDVVERRVAAAMKYRPFGLVLDGWSEDSTHFIGLFASLPGRRLGEPSQLILLAFAPMLDEQSFDAKTHHAFIVGTLKWYGFSDESIDRWLVCLIGDNCLTNKATVNLFSSPLIGCHSHRFNLAVDQFLQSNLSGPLAKVAAVMMKLRTLKMAGRLRLTTMLKPKLRNATRWTGAVAMLQRYIHFRDGNHIDATDREMSWLLPTPLEDSIIRHHLVALVKFKSITIALQRRDITLPEMRAIFDDIRREFPCLDEYLAPNGKIVHDEAFESGVTKVQGGNESALTPAEMSTLSRLRCAVEMATTGDDVTSADYATAILKRQRTLAIPALPFVRTEFLLSTSNDVERLFSMSKRLFTMRRRLEPRTLEMLVFLRFNRDMWSISDIVNIVNSNVNDTEESKREGECIFESDEED